MASFTVFPYPVPTNCEKVDIDCSDPNSVFIHVILTIAKNEPMSTINGGVSLSQIGAYVGILCPQLNWTNDELQVNLTKSLRRGVLTTVYDPDNLTTTTPTYAINAGMWRMNPANKKYFCISQLYTSQVRVNLS